MSDMQSVTRSSDNRQNRKKISYSPEPDSNEVRRTAQHKLAAGTAHSSSTRKLHRKQTVA